MILIPTIILIVGSANAKSKLKIVEFSIDTSGKVSTCGHNSWNLAVGAIYIVHIWPLNQELNTLSMPPLVTFLRVVIII